MICLSRINPNLNVVFSSGNTYERKYTTLSNAITQMVMAGVMTGLKSFSPESPNGKFWSVFADMNIHECLKV